jgi:hypothetical protein
MLRFAKSRLAGKKLVLVFGLLVFFFSPKIISQQDTLSDIFPLKVGNSWMYSFETNAGYPAVHYTVRDIGIAEYSIENSIIFLDHTTWKFKADRNYTRYIITDNGTTSEIKTDELVFDIVEKHQNYHQLYTPVNDWLSVYPFFYDAPDSEKFYRYVLTGSTDCDSIELVIFQSSLPYYANHYVCKDRGIVSTSGFLFNLASYSVRTNYQLIDSVTNINIIESAPNKFTLSQNYPNPFNPSTKISWQSPISGWQTLKVYDVLGNEVATLVNEYRSSGSYEIEFNPSSINHHPSSGVYFYRLQAGDYVETKKMILLK